MQAEIQKLELIAWIASIDDKGVLEKLYAVKKALEPEKQSKKKPQASSQAADQLNRDEALQKAAQLLLKDYENDGELTAFSILDGEDIYETK
ncbi:MAG: hypothetical protein H6577_06700 [Lewinellaceae bacterium]|nr:hypothetical protein [Saprospiraceae bacterium]MCB9337798.1 hypothetical protein [Lewinellaceae bacterium]